MGRQSKTWVGAAGGHPTTLGGSAQAPTNQPGEWAPEPPPPILAHAESSQMARITKWCFLGALAMCPNSWVLGWSFTVLQAHHSVNQISAYDTGNAQLKLQA